MIIQCLFACRAVAAGAAVGGREMFRLNELYLRVGDDEELGDAVADVVAMRLEIGSFAEAQAGLELCHNLATVAGVDDADGVGEEDVLLADGGTGKDETNVATGDFNGDASAVGGAAVFVEYE